MKNLSGARILIAACLSLLWVLPAHANNVYTINTTSTNIYPTGNPLQSDTVFGTITTDGILGVLSASNILSWDLNLIDNLNAANNFHLTTINSVLVHDAGNALSATASSLSFDYSIVNAEFLIQGNITHGISSGWNNFCFSATGGWCLPGETIAPQYVYADGVIVTGASAPTGPKSLNQSSIPEPSIFTLFMIGLLALVSNLKLKYRN